MSKPRPLFVYGTLRAMPLLAWALTGDPKKTDLVSPLALPGTVKGYSRFSLYHCDYPAVIPDLHPESKSASESESEVDGYLLLLTTPSQRRKLDDFEGETYKPTAVSVHLTCTRSHPSPSQECKCEMIETETESEMTEIVDADMYVWDGDLDQLSTQPWSLDTFVKERLGDWLEIFGGMELVGDDGDG